MTGSRRGPAKTPTQLRVLHGDEKRHTREDEPKPPPDLPAAPRFLSPAARICWKRLVPLLEPLRLATAADLETFVILCETWAIWRQALKELGRDRTRVTSASTHAREAGHAVRIRNASYLVARDAARDFYRFAGEFGLTPSARSGISLEGLGLIPRGGGGAADDDETLTPRRGVRQG